MIAMSEFEPDSESVARADELSSRLVHDLHAFSRESPSYETRQDLFSEQHYSEQAQGMRIDDVVENVAQMSREFSVGRRWGGTVLCLDLGDGELAPISIAPLVGEAWGSFSSEDVFEFLHRYDFSPFPGPLRKELLRRAYVFEDRVKEASLEDAEEGVRRSLGRFLAYRFAGLKMGSETSFRFIQQLRSRLFGGPRQSRDGGAASGGAPPPSGGRVGGGLKVQVSCRTPGLRIHISPAYFINWVYFGSPTTPVTSYVLPGRYIFSADGPMLPKRKVDTGVFCIPPSYRPCLVRF
jgi:hypothetical protein